ncbi:MAG TPA: hypothetical protein VF432_13270 [Thermoanaerobaculia bacterium]
MPVSFQNDVAPMFSPFQAAMRWRFNLLDYDNVKANATIIYARISVTESPTGQIPMPPPPFTPLTSAQVATFRQWMEEGFPP